MRAEIEFPEGPGPLLREAASALAERMEVHVDIEPDIDVLSRLRVNALLRVAREALRNVERHSGARRVEISLRAEADKVVLRIVDDGIGFDPARPPSGHYGLLGMFEQAKLAGGFLDIDAPSSGGAALTLRIPAG